VGGGFVNWTEKRVLVTGAGGFIGSHLAERLTESGAKVRAMVHYNSFNRAGWLDHSALRGQVEIFAGDICDQESVREAIRGCEIVFHLAALIGIPYSYHAPRSYLRTNAEGTINVLQAARESGVQRVVHTSTSEVYGTAKYIPIDEAHPLQGQSPYSASKIAADKLAEAFQLSFGVPVVTVRPFNTFGPRQSARAVIPTVIAQCLEGGQSIRLGSLHPTRDLNYVENTVAGFLAAGARPEAIGRTINLGSNSEISIGNLAALIIKLTGSSATIECEQERVRPEGSEVERLWADNELAGKVLGWRPAFSLEEGLRRTIEWMRGNLDCYRTGVYVR
jgi:NAD dependent epimerase/dehydratase